MYVCMYVFIYTCMNVCMCMLFTRLDQILLNGNNITTTQVGGSAGSLAGTIGTNGAVSITAGGPGSTGIGQFVSEITVFD